MKEHTNTPLVSIIMPLFNAERYIKQAIISVFNQTYTHWELIIIDDCSTDNSYCIALDLTKDNAQCTIYKNKLNQGAGYSRNKAIKLAAGTYIAFLDADDLWLPLKLEKQVKAMQRTGALVCHSSYYHIDGLGNTTNKQVNAISSLTLKKLHKNNYLGNLTGVYNAAVLGKIFAPELKKRQDWALWYIAIKKSNIPAIGLQEPLAAYRLHANSMSANKVSLLKYNYLFYRQFLQYSILKSSRWLLLFLWEYFMIRPKYISKEGANNTSG